MGIRSIGVVAGLGVWLALGAASAEERPRSVRLLVACDDAARPKVLEALRGLDVSVYDVATMERVPLPEAAPKPVENVPPPVDALRVVRAVGKAVDSALSGAKAGSAFSVEQLEVDGRWTSVTGFSSDATLLDAFAAALPTQEGLAGVRPERGDVVRDAKAATFRYTLRFGTPTSLRLDVPREGTPLPIASVVNAVQVSGARVRSIGAAKMDRQGRESQTVQIEVSDPAGFEPTVRALTELPSAGVPSLRWVAHPSGGGAGLLEVKLTGPFPR